MAKESALASDCIDGFDIGPAVEPGRMVSARYSNGTWFVRVEGRWPYSSPAPWGRRDDNADTEHMHVVACELEIDAATARIVKRSDWTDVTVTITPSAARTETPPAARSTTASP